jgi:hypothetical protein
MGKKSTTTKNDPWAPAQPYILSGLAETDRVAKAQQPQLDRFSAMQMDTYGRLAPGAEAGIQGSQSLVNDTIGGKYLTGNPYLEGIIDKTRRNVTDTVNGQFNGAGRFGSAANSGVLARELADAENSARYGNYAQERQNQIGAIGQSQDLMRGSQSLLNNAAELPWISVQAQNGGVRQASQGYGTTTQTTRDPWGTITGLAGAGASAYSGAAAASDERIKNIGPRVGTTPDGLPIYDYTYKADPAQTPQTGVMAQDVEQVRPDAAVTMPDGGKGVDYGKLGLPAPGMMAMRPDWAEKQAPIPDAQLRAPKRSFLDGFISPDTSTTAGKIGLLGQYLMASEGSPLQGLGQGLLAGRADERDRMTEDRRLGIQEQQADALAGYREAQLAASRARLERGGRGRVFQRRDGSFVRENEETGELEAVTGLPAMAAPSEPVVATAQGFVPRSQAPGKMPYQAPLRSGGGGKPGGVPPASAAKFRAEAAAAIARGAPAAAVNARLAQILGGQ